MTTIIFESDARYNSVMTNNFTGAEAHLTLDDQGVFRAVNSMTQELIIETKITDIERIYDYYVAFVITVQGKEYRFNFDRRVKVRWAVIFGGLYTWIASSINNPLKGVKKQWLEQFEKQGLKVKRDNIGRSIAIGLGVGILAIVLLIAVFVLLAR